MTDPMSKPPPVDADAVVEDIMSTLVSLHTSADAFQLTEYNKALHRTTPGGKLARFFAKGEKTEPPSVTLDQMLQHQLEPLPAPLLRSSGAMFHSKALKCFALIQRFSEDRCLTIDHGLETAQKLLQMGLRHPEIKDEIYLQLFKQTRGNSDASSRQQLWMLFEVVAATMPPSKEFVSLLSHYIHEVAQDFDEVKEVKDKAIATMQSLKRSVRSGCRCWLPSVEEIKSMLTNQKLKTVVYFLDETCEEIEYDIATTILEAVEHISQIIKLVHYHSFSLFETHETPDNGEEYALLDDQAYLADVLNDLGRSPQRIGRLMFKKRMFRESDDGVTETMFLNLSYIQVQHDYLQGHYPVVYEDAAQLCALQLFAEFGAQLPGDDKRLKRAIEKFRIREVKRMRSWEEWKADVLLRCTTLKCTCSSIAQYAFISLLRSLPYGNSVFFHVARLDDPIGLLPPKLVLGINSKGVHFFRPIPKEYLHSVELRDIMQFGSSTRAVFFKMRVAGVLHVFQFETRHGEDICMALQTHINDIMVKRYATLPVALQSENALKAHLEDRELMILQKGIDQAIQKQVHLTRLQEKHIRDRDRDVGLLQDAVRQAMHVQKQKLEISGHVSGLQTEIVGLESRLDGVQKAKGRVAVGQLIRYFEDTAAVQLEKARAQEWELQIKVQELHKDKAMMQSAFDELGQCKAQELRALNDVLFDVTSEGRSHVHLQEARLTAIVEEIGQLKQHLREGEEEKRNLDRDLKELVELKALKREVEKRNARHAEVMEFQKQSLKQTESFYKKEQVSRKKLYNKIEDMKGKIRVYARVRPILPKEEMLNQTCALQFPDDVTLSHVWKREDCVREYVFDGVFGPSASQLDVFEDIRELIQSAVDGSNVCIFAYGQTGSGKTYTIHGTTDQPGLAPRGIETLFDTLHKNADRFRFNVSCYMLELYQDTLMDLLLFKNGSSEFSDGRSSSGSRRTEQRLEIKKDRNSMVKVRGVTMIEVHSAEELVAAFEEGQSHRHVAATQLNIASSRSHLIMSVVIECTDLQTQAQTRGKLSFVDLAGSERNKKSGSTGEQLKEAQAINKSLSALGDVISALARKKPYIPYRNHKLTMLMSDSLGGNAKTLMFVNVAPTDANLDETQNSLQYAMRVRTIKNEATKETDKQAAALKKRIAFWKCMTTPDRQSDVQQLLQAFQ